MKKFTNNAILTVLLCALSINAKASYNIPVPVPGNLGGYGPPLVYNVQAAPYNAVCNGVHDDTAAFTAASLAASTAAQANTGVGHVVFAGQCAVCNVTLYRQSVIDGGNINGSELIETPTCTSAAVQTQGYTTYHGTTTTYPTSPSFMGLMNMRINGNAVNGATGAGYNSYGNMPILQSVMTYNTYLNGINVELGAGSAGPEAGGPWQGQPETMIDQIFALTSQTGWGYETNGPNDQRLGDIITAGNYMGGFYSTNIAGIDSMKSLHSYGDGAGNNLLGILFDSEVFVTDMETDGDTATMTGRDTGGHVGLLFQYNCPSNESCLKQGGSGVWFDEISGGVFSGTNNAIDIDWNAIDGGVAHINLFGNNNGANNTALKIQGYSSDFLDIQINGFQGTGNTCIAQYQSNGKIIGSTYQCTTHLYYQGYNNSITNLQMSDTAANTAYSGPGPQTGDTFNLQISSPLTQSSVSIDPLPKTFNSTVNNLTLNNATAVSTSTATYYEVATLASNTYDHINMEVELNDNWFATNNSILDMTFANRGSFTYSYNIKGYPTPTNEKVVAYNNSGVISIYIVHTGTSTYTTHAVTIKTELGETIYPTLPSTTTTPSGTVVFDSSSATYPPGVVSNLSGKAAIGTTSFATNASLSVGGAIARTGDISNGTKFTTSGCSISATTGGATAGTYTSGTTGTCTAVITMAGATGITAPNGWSCSANDITTTADTQKQTASSTTTATIAGTTVSGDVVNFSCTGY